MRARRLLPTVGKRYSVWRVTPGGVPNILSSGQIRRAALLEAAWETRTLTYWSKLHPERWRPGSHAVVLPDGVVPTQ